MADEQQPEDAVGAFVQAATDWTAATTPDPRVSGAFGLGWRVGEALTWATAGEAHRPLGVADLGLDDPARRAVLAGQIERRAKELLAAAAPVVPPEGCHADDVTRYRASLLKALYIVDDALGKAFRLGHGLQQFCDPAATQPGAAAEPASIPPLKQLLIDLGTKLPPNAGHSVRNSLTLWEEQIAAPRAADVLLRQGEVWRAILAGELAAKDVLRLSDYVGTADQVVERMRELALRSLPRLWRGGLIVLGLIVLGVVILVVSTSDSAVAASATTLIAAFGLTWKGLGATIGKAAAKGEQEVWNAQLDWAIAYRATVSIEPEQADPRTQQRQRHLQTFRDWRRRWPELDVTGQDD